MAVEKPDYEAEMARSRLLADKIKRLFDDADAHQMVSSAALAFAAAEIIPTLGQSPLTWLSHFTKFVLIILSEDRR